MWKPITDINTPNETKYFYPADDNWEMKELPMIASTVLAEGAAIGIEISGNDVTGNLTLMWTENAAGADFVGIIAEPVIATDTDYATAGKLKGVRVPKTPWARAYFAVGAGTFTAADVFKTVEITAGALGLSVDTAWLGARIREYLTSTTGICEFSMPNTETA